MATLECIFSTENVFIDSAMVSSFFFPVAIEPGGTMGTLCSKRVDKLETMFFGHFKHTVQHYMTSNGFFAKKKNLVVPHIFQNFKPTIRGRY